jgi:VWFA-related protein
MADLLGMAIPLSCRWPLASLAVLCAGLSPAAGGDKPEFTYRTNPTEVRLIFSAIDQNDHGVATLQASDFAVVDKGFIVRNFQSFNRSDWTKLEIAILVDASGSVSPRFRRETADVLELISQTTGVPEENLSIFSFNGLRPAQVCAGDCRITHAADRLPETLAGGLTPLFDTVAFATSFLGRRGDIEAERVLIVFSDGDDTISQTSIGNAIDVALKNDVSIYCVDLNQSRSASQGAAVLYSLSGATGGRYFAPGKSATEALDSILEGFRGSYTVSYRLPTRARGFHEIRVLPTHNTKLQFRARSGYYYPNYFH